MLVTRRDHLLKNTLRIGRVNWLASSFKDKPLYLRRVKIP